MRLSLPCVRGRRGIDDNSERGFFLKLFAKTLLEAFLLVEQEQQLGAHTGKYTKKIELILQRPRKCEVLPHRVYFIGTLDHSLRPQGHTAFSTCKPPGHEYSEVAAL